MQWKVEQCLDAAELQARLTNVYREARTAREEGGVNSLYLAVGFLCYRETRQATRTRRAPLLLIPLEIKRKSGRAGYSLVKGGDETRINVTLLEYLRRDHDVDITGLDPLPEDENGVPLTASPRRASSAPPPPPALATRRAPRHAALLPPVHHGGSIRSTRLRAPQCCSQSHRPPRGLHAPRAARCAPPWRMPNSARF